MPLTMRQRAEIAREQQIKKASQHFKGDTRKSNKKKLPTTFTKIKYIYSTQGPTKYLVRQWWYLLPSVMKF